MVDKSILLRKADISVKLKNYFRFYLNLILIFVGETMQNFQVLRKFCIELNTHFGFGQLMDSLLYLLIF